MDNYRAQRQEEISQGARCGCERRETQGEGIGTQGKGDELIEHLAVDAKNWQHQCEEGGAGHRLKQKARERLKRRECIFEQAFDV